MTPKERAELAHSELMLAVTGDDYVNVIAKHLEEHVSDTSEARERVWEELCETHSELHVLRMRHEELRVFFRSLQDLLAALRRSNV